MSLLVGAPASFRRRAVKLDSDPYFDSVISLQHFDGADESTSFVDVIDGVSWTAAGGAQLDTDQSKFGGSSLLSDSSDDYLFTSDLPNLDQSAFTIDFWVRFKSGTRAHSSQAILSRWNTSVSSSQSFLLFFGAASTSAAPNSISFDWRSGSSSYVGNSQAHTFAFDTWYHIEVNRSANTLRYFVDGVKIKDSAVANTHNNSTYAYRVSRLDHSTVPMHLNGHLDDLRVTNGVARNTSNYSPPTKPFPNR